MALSAEYYPVLRIEKFGEKPHQTRPAYASFSGSSENTAFRVSVQTWSRLSLPLWSEELVDGIPSFLPFFFLCSSGR
jgi:hypothetical protein